MFRFNSINVSILLSVIVIYVSFLRYVNMFAPNYDKENKEQDDVVQKRDSKRFRT